MPTHYRTELGKIYSTLSREKRLGLENDLITICRDILERGGVSLEFLAGLLGVLPLLRQREVELVDRVFLSGLSL